MAEISRTSARPGSASNSQSASTTQSHLSSPGQTRPSPTSPYTTPTDLESSITFWNTLEIAASIVARLDPKLIRADMLPRVAPIAHAHLPHEFGLNHDLLADTVWSSIELLKRAVQKARKGSAWGEWTSKSLWILGGLSIVLLLFATDQRNWSATRVTLVVAPISFLCAWLLRNAPRRPSAALLREKQKIISDLRRGKLPAGIEDFQASHPQTRRPKAHDAKIGNESTLILLRFDPEEEDFPGMGQTIELDTLSANLSAEEDATDRLGDGEEDLFFDALKKHLTAAFPSQTSHSCSIGSVIAIDASSLQRSGDASSNSWFGTTSVPYGSIRSDNSLIPSRTRAAHPFASARLYLAIQVHDPEFRVMATAFVRPIVRCGTAFVNMSVTIIGPPRAGWAFVDRWLIDNAVFLKRMEDKPRASHPIYPSLRGLLNLDPAYPFGDPSTGTRSERKAKKKAEENRARWKTAFEAASVRWLGFFDMPRRSQREVASSPLSDRVFGQEECRLMARSLVSGVIRATLEAYETLGYDVEKYKGDKGLWSIRVDSIDKMVIGEKVSVIEDRNVNAPQIVAVAEKKEAQKEQQPANRTKKKRRSS